MKLRMSIVVAGFVVFNVESREWYIRNESRDSFNVDVFISDSRVVITPLIAGVDQSKILGTVEQPHGGKGSARREKRYNVAFEEGYVPPAEERPFISFQNDNSEFRLVFFDENYAELHSNMASERHDDPSRREQDRLYNQDYYGGKNADVGNVKHWISFDRYLAVCCYKTYRFAVRCIDICDASGNIPEIQNFKEDEFDFLLDDFTQPPEKTNWWSRLCSRCTD